MHLLVWGAFRPCDSHCRSSGIEEISIPLGSRVWPNIPIDLASPGMDHSEMLRLSRASLVLSPAEVDTVKKFGPPLRRFLRGKAIDLISSDDLAPALFQYSSDTTPLSTLETYTKTAGDLKVRRKGRQGNDILIERFFVRTPLGTAVCLCEPRRLLDKTTWCHFAAFDNMNCNPRDFGANGIVISFGCWDRAVCSSMSKLYDAYQERCLALASAAVDSGARRLLELTTWTLTGACKAHDAHRALRWALSTWIDDADTVKSAFLVIEALRNSYSMLVEHLPLWIAKTLRFSDWSMNKQYEFWTLLGVLPDTIDLLMYLQLRWEVDGLHVAARFEGDPNILHLVSTALLALWRYDKWSASRWVSIGPGCRALVASMATGLRDLVSFARKQPHTSEFFIHNFGRIDSDPGLRRFVCVAGISAWVADSALVLVMDDDRAAAVGQELHQETWALRCLFPVA